MANAAGESESSALQLDFDRRLMLQFRGSVVTSDAGLLAYRELDDVLRLTALAGEMLADARTGKNGRHALVGLLRQSVFGRLAGYEESFELPLGCQERSGASSGLTTSSLLFDRDVLFMHPPHCAVSWVVPFKSRARN
jgi:Transposase DDE domain group 1